MTNTQKIYLDYAATAPLSESMKTYLISILDLWGNPSSLHSAGEPARQAGQLQNLLMQTLMTFILPAEAPPAIPWQSRDMIKNITAPFFTLPPRINPS